jgi:hypothetical protein
MARVAKAIKSPKSVTPVRKNGRLPTIAKRKATKSTKLETMKRPAAVAAPTAKRKPGRLAKPVIAPPPKAIRVTKPTVRPLAAPLTPKVSKDDLRAQVDKLEQLVETLRAKSRESNKAAKAAATRISDLETLVVRLEKQAAAAPASAPQPAPAKPPRAKRRSREIDPGDAVPPGVAVLEPAPLDEEAETALENLEEHLSHG